MPLLCIFYYYRSRGVLHLKANFEKVMDMNSDKRQNGSAADETPKTSSTPTHVRVLALIGALAVLGLSIAYAWSIATGGIFAF